MWYEAFLQTLRCVCLMLGELIDEKFHVIIFSAAGGRCANTRRKVKNTHQPLPLSFLQYPRPCYNNLNNEIRIHHVAVSPGSQHPPIPPRLLAYALPPVPLHLSFRSRQPTRRSTQQCRPKLLFVVPEGAISLELDVHTYERLEE